MATGIAIKKIHLGRKAGNYIIELEYKHPVEIYMGYAPLQLFRFSDLPHDIKRFFNEEIGFFIINPQKPTEEFKGLRDGESVGIGRNYPGRFDSIRLDGNVSPAHVRITRKGNRIEIKDLNSALGTTVFVTSDTPVKIIESEHEEKVNKAQEQEAQLEAAKEKLRSSL